MHFSSNESSFDKENNGLQFMYLKKFLKYIYMKQSMKTSDLISAQFTPSI